MSPSSSARQSIVAGPRFARLPVAVETRGLGRGTLYKLATKHKGLFRKHGTITLVDLFLLDEIIADCPSAEINISAA